MSTFDSFVRQEKRKKENHTPEVLREPDWVTVCGVPVYDSDGVLPDGTRFFERVIVPRLAREHPSRGKLRVVRTLAGHSRWELHRWDGEAWREVVRERSLERAIEALRKEIE